MLNNVLEADAFEISRIPIQSPRSTKKGEGDPRCAAPPPERPVQVHRCPHHVEVVAVAERVDEVDAREQKKAIKTAASIQPSHYHVWQMSKHYGL